MHGGPGAAGEMKPVAEVLSEDFGVLECLQTRRTIAEQLDELYEQLIYSADIPVTLIGYSWGAWLGFLFAAYYPEKVRKLVLIGSGAFERKYNKDLMRIRLERLTKEQKEEAEFISKEINAGSLEVGMMARFGELMDIADSYEYFSDRKIPIQLDEKIHQSVWAEASQWRDSDKLINYAEDITCPVIAFHGDFDPHPVDGVEKPLSERLAKFKMIRLEKCGHTPWKERHAHSSFFQLLKKEIT